MRRPISRRRALTTGVALVMMLCAGPQLTSDSAPATGDLVGAFNSRPLGSPGVRRVRLELESGSTITRTFGVVHAWRESSEAVTSLAFLESPPGLAGTGYLLSENRRVPAGLEVFLRLRLTGRRVLAIASERFDEGLLGSDFSYADLLWRIPTEGRQLTLVGRRPFGSASAWVIESRPATATVRAAVPWARVDYYFSGEPEALLLGADYFERTTGAPVPRGPSKTLRVLDWTRRDGVWTPSRMIMARPDGRRSVMTLVSLRLGVEELRQSLFTPPALALLGQQFEEGRPPRALEEDGR